MAGWSDGSLWAVLPPVVLTITIFLICSIWHCCRIKQASFQGVYVRVLLVFPVASLLAFLSGEFVEASPAISIAISFVESYLLVIFLGLVVGYAWTQGDVYTALLDSELTKHQFYCVRGFGRVYEDGLSAMRPMRWQVYQYVLFRPLTDILEAIVIYTNPDAFNLSRHILGAINILSFLIAFRALLLMYRMLKEENLLNGFKPILKFIVVKALLGLVILNQAIIDPLVSNGKMTVPDFICSRNLTEAEPNICQVRYEEWIFIVGVSILMVLAAASFTPYDMDSLPKEYLRETSGWLLLYHIFTLSDVIFRFMLRPENCIYRDSAPKEVKSGVQTDKEETGEELTQV